VDDPIWVPTVFSKNRDRLLEGDIAAAFMTQVLHLRPALAHLPHRRCPAAHGFAAPSIAA
jgi:hypothetical protein